MIHAEISIYPMAAGTPSMSLYIARAVESIQDMAGVRYELGPMGTVLESQEMGPVLEAVDRMVETVHNLGIARVEAVIKIDSRRDRQAGIGEKLESVRRHMG